MMFVWYDYEVDVGSGCGTGSVLVPENATDDEIQLAIMNDLYSVNYRKREPVESDKDGYA